MLSQIFQTVNSLFTTEKYSDLEPLVTFSEVWLDILYGDTPALTRSYLPSPFQAVKPYVMSYTWRGTTDFSSAPLLLLFPSHFSPTLSFTSFSMLPLTVWITSHLPHAKSPLDPSLKPASFAQPTYADVFSTTSPFILHLNYCPINHICLA